MAKNGANGAGTVGTVEGRRQVPNPKTGLWTHRDTSTGRFAATKAAGGSFRGVKREGAGPSLWQTILAWLGR